MLVGYIDKHHVRRENIQCMDWGNVQKISKEKGYTDKKRGQPWNGNMDSGKPCWTWYNDVFCQSMFYCRPFELLHRKRASLLKMAAGESHPADRWSQWPPEHSQSHVHSLTENVCQYVISLWFQTKSIEAQEAKLNRAFHCNSWAHDMTIAAAILDWKLHRIMGASCAWPTYNNTFKVYIYIYQKKNIYIYIYIYICVCIILKYKGLLLSALH